MLKFLIKILRNFFIAEKIPIKTIRICIYFIFKGFFLSISKEQKENHSYILSHIHLYTYIIFLYLKKCESL